MLEQTVRELKGEDIEDDVRATVNLGVDLRIDESYVADMNQRLMLYRKVAAARREDEIDRVLEEAVDRYGPLPDSVLNLADYGRIRVMADRLGIEAVDREGRTVVLKFRPQAKIDPVRLVSLGAAADGPDTGAACVAQAEHEPGVVVHARSAERRGRTRIAPSWWTARARETEVKAGFHEGRDPQTDRERRSAGRRRRVRARRRFVE